MMSEITRYTHKTFLMVVAGLVFFSFIHDAFADRDVLLERVDDEIIREVRNGSMWQLDRGNKLRSEQEVERYLDKLNSGHYKDWRLPTKSELYRFYEIFDWKQNGDVKIKIEGDYWLVDSTNMVKAGEWEPDDLCGPVRVFYSKKSGYVRAIRP